MIIDYDVPPADMSPEQIVRWVEVLRGMPRIDFIVFKLVVVRRLGMVRAAKRVRISRRRARRHLLNAICYIARNAPP